MDIHQWVHIFEAAPRGAAHSPARKERRKGQGKSCLCRKNPEKTLGFFRFCAERDRNARTRKRKTEISERRGPLVAGTPKNPRIKDKCSQIQNSQTEGYRFLYILNKANRNITKNMRKYACVPQKLGYNQCQKEQKPLFCVKNDGFSLLETFFHQVGISEAAAAYILRRAGGACPRPGKTGTLCRILPGALHEKRMVHP